jgi:hypothetical protein
MAHSSASALVTDNGRRVHLRIHGRFYELSQDELRSLLGLTAGPPGLGITIDGERIRFEFACDQQAIELTGNQLSRRLARQTMKAT